MRIAIDATAVPRQAAGAGIYTREIVRSLLACDPTNGYVIFTRGDAFAEELAGSPNARLVPVDPPGRAGRLIWEQAVLPVLLRRFRVDLLHSPHHTTPVAPMPQRRVVTVHDVTFFLYPQRYGPVRRRYMQTLTRLSLRVADAIIVPSESVRRDIAEVGLASHGTTHVVHEGTRFSAVEDIRLVEAARQKYASGEPYLLNVGSLEPGKNQVAIVRALKRLRDAGILIRLVIAGQPAWDYAHLMSVVKELRLEDAVNIAGYVSDVDLAALYTGADAFVFPSIHEGFGLPILEAMACGAPVICSNRSALPEVAGKAALLIDPQSIDELAAAMQAVIVDTELRSTLRTAGYRRAAEISWERAAKLTLQIYKAT